MTAQLLTNVRGLGRHVALYFCAIALVGFAIDGGIYSVLFNLFLLRLGYGTEFIGVINGAAQLTFALSSLPAGALGARFGARRMLLLGIALMLAACGLLPFADVVPPAIRLAWIITNFAVLYFGIALYFVNTAPFLLGLIAPDERNRAFGIQSALMAVAAFAGSIAGGLLPPFFATLIGAGLHEPAPYRYPLLLAAFVMLPAMLAVRATPDEVSSAAEVPGAVVPGGTLQLTIPSVILAAILMMGVVRLLQVAALASVSNFFNVYLDRGLGISTAQIGTITAFGRLLAAPAALATASLSRRFGSVSVVTWSTLMSALAMLPLTFVPHWSTAGVSLVLVVGFSSIRYSSSLVYFLELVPPRRRATVAGVTEMAAGVSFTLVALLGGYLIAWYGYALLFGLAATATVFGSVVFWAYFRGLQRS